MGIFAAAVSAVEPRRVVAAAFEVQVPGAQGVAETLEKANRVYLLAVGKAAMGMAIEGRERIGAKLHDALVVVPGPVTETVGSPRPGLPRLRVMAGAHPFRMSRRKRPAARRLSLSPMRNATISSSLCSAVAPRL